MSYKVVVSDTKVIDGETRAAVLDAVDATVETIASKEPAAVARAVKDVDAVIVDAGTQVTAEVIDAADSLKVVGRAGIGVDNIDVQAAVEAGVTVVNVPEYSVEEVSTHTFALVLACLRKIPTFDRSVKRGEWEWAVGQPIRRLAGSTVGLVAFGKLASRFAAKLRGFDVDVIAYDPYAPEYRMGDLDVESVTFETLLSDSDIVSLHAPLTDETRGMIDADALDQMHDDALLVNTARGGLVDETALYDALVSSDLGGAGLDVREAEPPGDSPLHDLDSVVCTPHVAWYSEASRVELTQTVTEDVIRVLRGEAPENPIDPETGWF
ncbi:C-terminal binding protein [Haloarcula argentinensis]|uniref:C-terminal binding protein n=1 Tax=Haloarcula argentinensis TaxID=43776 RepID=A0ABU2F0S7_HALAR|nr:C-terminal binding protein [Haloarcula argentinensis]EMA18858.1 D-3-phosphoglycerate dehydrogenase [Haloarcula argentinensis DSM 12282]MDS0254143.1 C-terminal binding protein [Haloarcula argentinensis]